MGFIDYQGTGKSSFQGFAPSNNELAVVFGFECDFRAPFAKIAILRCELRVSFLGRAIAVDVGMTGLRARFADWHFQGSGDNRIDIQVILGIADGMVACKQLCKSFRVDCVKIDRCD